METIKGNGYGGEGGGGGCSIAFVKENSFVDQGMDVVLLVTVLMTLFMLRKKKKGR